MKFSIITPSFNSEKTIEDTIKSVMNQTCIECVEHIIVDGKSKDGTIDIVKKYQGPHLKYVSEKDNGIYDAMNKGIGLASGDYLLFLGSDDVLVNDACQTVLDSLSDEKVDVFYGNVRHKNSGVVKAGKTNSWKILSYNIPHQAIFYHRSVFDRYKYDTDYKIYADYILNLKCWKDKEIRFRYIPHIISVYNEGGVSSLGTDPLFRKNVLKISYEYSNWYITPFIMIRRMLGLLAKKLHVREDRVNM